jgi:hypothetical protein
MKTTRRQFSLRQLLFVMTVVAAAMTLVSHHWRFVIGLVTLAAALVEAFYPVVEMFAGFLDPRNWRKLREQKPTRREIQKCAEEFAARYRKRPKATTNSGEQSASR